MQIGIQLYTVRDPLQKDFSGTLGDLADMGYQGVEFAWNYGGMAPEELKTLLDKLNLKTCGLHAPLLDLLNHNSDVYRYARVLQSPYVSTSLNDEVKSNWLATIYNLDRVDQIAKNHNLVFTYHHHAQEFQIVNDCIALDLLMENTSVQVELDTHWITKGGHDPIAYINTYADRCPQLHLKDVAADQGFCPLGQGVLNLEAIITVARETAVQWFIVEQDQANGSSLDAARTSIEYLKNLA